MPTSGLVSIHNSFQPLVSFSLAKSIATDRRALDSKEIRVRRLFYVIYVVILRLDL